MKILTKELRNNIDFQEIQCALNSVEKRTMPIFFLNGDEGIENSDMRIVRTQFNMRDFFKEKQPIRYTDCVVIYRHVYDRQRPERQYRDHDNFEINFVTDTVAMYVLPDDNPTVCTHYYCSAKSSLERTEVYIVPKADFKQWLDMEPNMPDKGVLLYENKP